jgi:hypothetical protein
MKINISNVINKRLIDIVQEKFPKVAQDITSFTSFYISLYYCPHQGSNPDPTFLPLLLSTSRIEPRPYFSPFTIVHIKDRTPTSVCVTEMGMFLGFLGGLFFLCGVFFLGGLFFNFMWL